MRFRAAALTAAGVLITTPALGATWTGGRTTPSLTEMFAVDRTGEPGWLYGSEDLAGDGTTFQQQEKNIDIRTAYASTDAQELWVRTYISDTATPGGNVTVYVFIDSDKNATTGGSAASTDIDAKFTDDPSPGGYEYVVGVRGNESIVDVWEWDGTQFAVLTTNPNQTDAEVDTDLDPIRINEDVHGYLQLRVNLQLVGLDQACNANLYVRSSNDSAVGAGDLEVGQVGGCIPADSNNDGIPDPLRPPNSCTDDAQCPGDGICRNGTCVLAVPCVDNADCAATEMCTADGRCVPLPGDPCTDTSECGDLVCRADQCSACTSDAECGAGSRCSPTGHCISDSGGGAGGSGGIQPTSNQDVQGGACSCSVPFGNGSSSAALLALLLPLVNIARRRSRRRGH